MVRMMAHYKGSLVSALPSSHSASNSTSTYQPILALLIGATSWGILWYPYRIMQANGLVAPVATVLTYIVSIAVGGVVFRRAWREFPAFSDTENSRNTAWMLGIGLSIGVSNVSYLVAIMEAEVLRIVLLFYLAPLWTVPLARWILREKLTVAGYATMVLAMAGAGVMLWRPELGLPAPRNGYEWLGLSAGFTFALCNVLVKGADHISPEAKSLAGAMGVFIVSLPVALFLGPNLNEWASLAAPHTLLIIVVGVILISTSVALQFGLSKLTANHAAVILLFELVVAAVAAHYLANEVSRVQDWVGGAMIVGAGLVTVFAPKFAPKLGGGSLGDGRKETA